MKREINANLEAPATASENEAKSKTVIPQRHSKFVISAITLALILSCFIVAAGQTTQPCESKPLEPTNDVTSLDGVTVNSALVMKMKTWYWLAADSGGPPPPPMAGTRLSLTAPTPCANSQVVRADLRTYGFPKIDPRTKEPICKWNDLKCLSKDENLNWVIPGPTFHIKHGQSLNLTLYNRMPFQDAHSHKCNPPVNEPPNYDAYPDCFHGDNVTNIHFHGFRVSPNAPQDNVFLELYPEDPTKLATTCPNNGDQATGCYSSHLDAIQNIQPVGTHWYHPHKHGATALQVINGLAGAFLVEGYFDDELQNSISKLEVNNPAVPAEQQVLVVQQIKDELNFFRKGQGDGGQFWINGQRQPIIYMKPGEIQRWRFVAAMQQIGGFLSLQFQGEQMRTRQIAQDGVPFDPINYNRQPLNVIKPDTILNLAALRRDKNPVFTRLTNAATSATIETKAAYLLAPGNRVDLLVVAPKTPGDYYLQYQKVANRSPIPTANEQLALQATQNVNTLLIVRVADDSRTAAICKNPVTCLQEVKLPPLPEYLRDIDPQPVKKETVAFSMNPPNPQSQNDAGSKVFIDNKLFTLNYIDHRVKLGRPEQWTITNTSSVPHPFHIHVNPFQVTQLMGKTLPQPWVWWDTFPLLIQQVDNDGNPVGGPGSVTIRQRFLGFTGKYVLHCHILGHEDRGMMQNVLAEP